MHILPSRSVQAITGAASRTEQANAATAPCAEPVIAASGPGAGSFPLWRSVAAILAGSVLFMLVLFIHPDDAVNAGIDNVGSLAGELLAVALCALALRRTPGLPVKTMALQRWIAVLLGINMLGDAGADAVWLVYQQFLHRDPPSPSLADALYLGTYPFLLAGVLLLPARPLRSIARARIGLDGLIIMASLLTCSWYAILSPLILQRHDSLLDEIVQLAYPLLDLAVTCCVVFLWARCTERALRPIVALVSVAMALSVAVDSLNSYEVLQGGYLPTPLDGVQVMTDLMIAVGACALGPALAAARERSSALSGPAERDAEAPGLQLLIALLPFALVPLVGGVLVYRALGHGALLRDVGVYAGGGAVVALVLLRQVVAIMENRQLYRRLHHAYLRSEESNQALSLANARLEMLATTDPLTGLLNRGAAIAALDQEIERAWRFERPCALLFIDLDHFKDLNDSRGHPAGDAALNELGAAVTVSLRGVDTLGRWGGEEFVAILPESDTDAALVTAERIRAAVAAHPFLDGTLCLTCSLGVAVYPRDATDRVDLVLAADRAMYAAKRLGRDQVRAAGDEAVRAAWLTAEISRKYA